MATLDSVDKRQPSIRSGSSKFSVLPLFLLFRCLGGRRSYQMWSNWMKFRPVAFVATEHEHERCTYNILAPAAALKIRFANGNNKTKWNANRTVVCRLLLNVCYLLWLVLTCFGWVQASVLHIEIWPRNKNLFFGSRRVHFVFSTRQFTKNIWFFAKIWIFNSCHFCIFRIHAALHFKLQQINNKVTHSVCGRLGDANQKFIEKT